jgi:hypothetical protein
VSRGTEVVDDTLVAQVPSLAGGETEQRLMGRRFPASIGILDGRHAGLHCAGDFLTERLRTGVRLVVGGHDHVRDAGGLPPFLFGDARANLSENQ